MLQPVTQIGKSNTSYYRLITISLLLLMSSLLFAQGGKEVTTEGDQSPAIIAKQVMIEYGVPLSVTLRLFNIYESKGLTSIQRINKVKSLIKSYKKNHQPNENQLSAQEQRNLGITGSPDIISALNYDVFLSTKGNQSPSIIANGNVEIWYGIPEGAFKSIWSKLEQNALSVDTISILLQIRTDRIKQLENELDFRDKNDSIALKAKKMIDRGSFDSAESILTDDYESDKRHIAYKAYSIGILKETDLKFIEASKFYKDAVEDDSNNFEYRYSYSLNLFVNQNLDGSVSQLKKSLYLYEKNRVSDTNKYYNLNSYLSSVYKVFRDMDSAVKYTRKCIEVVQNGTSYNVKLLAKAYNDLAEDYRVENQYDSSIFYFNKSLNILFDYEKNKPITRESAHIDSDRSLIKMNLPSSEKINRDNFQELYTEYRNKSEQLFRRSVDDSALLMERRALFVLSKAFDKNNFSIGMEYREIAKIFTDEHSYDSANIYLNLALNIFRRSSYFKNVIATLYYDKGTNFYLENSQYDSAIYFLNSSLQLLLAEKYKSKSDIKSIYTQLGNAWNARGINYRIRNEFENAYCCFSKAKFYWGKDKNNLRGKVLYYLNIGATLIDLGHYKEALVCLRAGTQTIGEINTGTYLILADTVKYPIAKKLSKEAKELFLSDMNFTYENDRLLFHEARCLEKLGRIQDELDVISQARGLAAKVNDSITLNDIKSKLDPIVDSNTNRKITDAVHDSVEIDIQAKDEKSTDSTQAYVRYIALKNVSRQKINVILRLPFGFYDECDNDDERFVTEGFVTKSVYLQPFESESVKVEKVLSRIAQRTNYQRCDGISKILLATSYVK